MTVRVNKSSFNIREKLSELGRKFGLKGSELAAAETIQEAREIVSAGRKNIIFNGNMMISQRYGFNNPQNAANSNNYYLDRFVVREHTDGVLQVRQSAPGYPFDNAMQLNVTTADTSLASSQYARIQYYVEGNDARAVDWGKSGSKDHLTLSFWVKTNAPGDYHVSIENSNNNYFPLMVKKYAIQKSNVWQKVVVTFPPPGEYNFHRGNGVGLRITWSLAIGGDYNQATDGVWRTSGYQMSTSSQRNLMDTAGNNFHITGVQLERSRHATEFEHRPYGEELALCQRYYEKFSADDGNGGYATFCHGGKSNNTLIIIEPVFRVPKRATAATMTWGGSIRFGGVGGVHNISMNSIQNAQLGIHGGYVVLIISSNTNPANGNDGYRLEGDGDTNAYIAFSSEL